MCFINAGSIIIFFGFLIYFFLGFFIIDLFSVSIIYTMIEDILNTQQLFTYTFKITNSVTSVNLPYVLQESKKLKIKYLKFTTASANNEIMLIKINGFNENVYYDGSKIIKCAKSLPLPSSTNTLFVYDNQAYNGYDVSVKSRENTSINSLYIEILIDNVYKDISVGNPLWVELEISG